MCIYFYYVSLKICAPSLFLLLSTIFSTDQKAYHRRQNPFPTRNFLGDFEPTVLSFFLPSWLSASQKGLCFEGKPQREYLFSVSHTSSVSSLFASRDASTSTIRTYTHTQHNSSKMFSLTQSASFCAGAKVNVAAQKKQQSKISRSIQAGKAISSESLSKRDFLSAAVLSFGFLSVGDANAATKRVRKSSSSSAAPVEKVSGRHEKVRRETRVQAERENRRPGAVRRDVASLETRPKRCANRREILLCFRG